LPEKAVVIEEGLKDPGNPVVPMHANGGDVVQDRWFKRGQTLFAGSRESFHTAQQRTTHEGFW